MEALKAFGQFILVRLVPQSDGSLDKIPVNPQGTAINPHDSRNWLTFANATMLAGTTYKLGFVLTENDPFFCVDIDHCLLPTNEWSPIAMEMVKFLPGAGMEVSQSGKGLHLWGRAGAIPPHKCKNTLLGLELYHEKRFILLGNQQQGDWGLDCSALLPTLIQRYFSPDETSQSGAVVDWTATAAEGWAGPESDEELVALACKATTANQAFGTAVSFEQLWEGDLDALARAWPSDGRPFDASSADASLAQRLAFWTGRNCERIQRMMKQSKLVREKYERPDYLRRTILSACARQVQIYTKPSPGTVETSRATGGWVAMADMPTVFAGCSYVRDLHMVFVPGARGGLLNPSQFRTEFGGRVFMLDESKTTRNAFEAFTECTYWSKPVAQSTCFRPDFEPGALIEREGRLLVNTWWPCKIDMRAGDVTPMTDYLHKLLPYGQDREILVAYLAACVQFIGHKFSWAPLLQGTEGNGKSLVATLVSRAIGERYSHSVNAQQLGDSGNKFNSWLVNKLFVYIDEVYAQDKREILETLKPLITERRIEIQGKGKDQYVGDNRANFLLSSNYVDAIPVTKDSRRYGIFLTAQQNTEDLQRDGMTPAYFADLWDWVEGRNAYAGQTPGWQCFAHYLKHYPIPDAMNPVNGARAPETTTTAQAIAASLGRIEQEIIEQVGQEAPGFAGGWISSMMLDGFLERKKLSSRMNPSRRKTMLEELGYVIHPALPEGRAACTVAPDNGRPRLYVRKGHVALNVTDAKHVASMYQNAQQKAAIGAIVAARIS
jgi:hypothetical protein